MFCLPQFLRFFWGVGQELESALVAQLQKDAVAFSVGVSDPKWDAVGSAWFDDALIVWLGGL